MSDPPAESTVVCSITRDLRATTVLSANDLPRGFRRVAERGLGLEVFVEGELAPLAPITAALVAAERRLHVETVVDRDGPRTDLARDRTGLVEIRAQNIASQAVFRVVGDLQG